jgi:hypothetical protein
MTGDKVYEKLAAMTPEERARLCYGEPWHVAYLKDMLKRMIEAGEVDPTEAELLLADEGRLTEMLDDAIGCEPVTDDEAFGVDNALRNRICDSIGIIVSMEERQ